MSTGSLAPEAEPLKTRLYSCQAEEPYSILITVLLAFDHKLPPFRLPFSIAPESSVKSLQCQLFLRWHLALSRHRVNICWINE